MRNKFYRFAAVWVAINMMSFTVLAAEDASSLSQPESNSPLLSTTGSEENAQGAGTGNASETTTETTSESTTENTADSTTETNSESQTSGSLDTNTEQVTPATENSETEKTPSGTEPASETTDTENKEATKEASGEEAEKAENPSAEGEKTAENTEEVKDKETDEDAPTDEEIAQKMEETKRRTALNLLNPSPENDTSNANTENTDSSQQTQEESWSNSPEIQDVMGIRAVVEGENVVISYKTKHSNDWEYTYGQNPIRINYADGNSSGKNNMISFDWNGFGVHGDDWSSIDGVTITKSSDQNDTEIVNVTIPASWFKNMDFTVSGGQYTASVTGTPVVVDHSNDATYEGISMDGTFNDWEAVTKTELLEPNDEHNVESVAWVIEKDYVYIYIKDDGSNSATWAGPNHNGKYAITTDLGRTLLIQLTEDGAVVQADGAYSNHVGSQWEIAIPTSALPENNGGLMFGLYLTDPTLEGYGDVTGNNSTTDIAYDGLCGDWDNYPHTEIQYATAGTQENVPDGEAAIYVDNAVYGHCDTRMKAHLDEQGGEFTQAVSVLVNDDWSHALMMRLVTVDEAGNINWNPNRLNLENGNHEYYIFATDAWGTSKNINDLAGQDICYGKATVSITDTKHDIEWMVDTAKLAARYGLQETDVKTVSSQYGRIGQQLVTLGGASSGPVGGAGLCILSALAPFVIKKSFIF